ncbi:AAA family ATPase [Niallia sp. 03133]|uniref:AAA family ATPase n=1 Tax=Niallia sp. 03133 TaxID=3458060 RepID=UPI004044D3C8
MAVNYLNKTIPNRIHIIGSVGSGKTTLARKLSEKYNIQFYELDNVVWERHKSGDIRRKDEERDKYLEAIINEKKWIIEGAHNHNWVRKSFNKADIIIFLDTPFIKREIRILKRYVRQLLGIESANYKPSFNMLLAMFKWNREFEKESKPNIIRMFQEEKANSIIIKTNSEIAKYIN